MSTTRADKAKDTPPKKQSAPREYEISVKTSAEPPAVPTYQRQGVTHATSAAGAIRAWCEAEGEKFTGGTVRAVPTGYITEAVVQVETKRQLTLGTP